MILVTGASGQIGLYIFESFANREEVIGVDVRDCPIKDLRSLFVLGDLRDAKLAERLVKDADVVKIAIKKGESCEAYNVGTGKETSVLELAEIILEITKLDLKPIFSEPRKGDIKRSCADIEKAKRIGFEPKTNLRKDLEDIFNNLKF